MKTVSKKNKKAPVTAPQEALRKETPLGYAKKKDKYFSGIGRRKSSTAQVRLYPQRKTEGQSMEISVNGKDYKRYFAAEKLYTASISPIALLNLQNRFKITSLASGGGKAAQAEAMRLAMARALIVANPIFKKPLKRAGFLTRDARKKERKKPGLKKARRAPQWQKR